MIAACWPPRRGWSWPWRLGWAWTWSWPWSRRGGLGRRLARSAARVAPIVVAGLTLALAFGAAQPPDPSPPRADAAKTRSGPVALTTAVSPREAVARGRTAYLAGKYEEALAAFDDAIRAASPAAIPRYDAAAALFALGRFDEARVRYDEARDRADAALATKIDYALGNTALALRDVPGAIAYYNSCIASTAREARA